MHKDTELLKHVQKRAMKLLICLVNKIYEEWLKTHVQVSMERKSLRGDLITLT